MTTLTPEEALFHYRRGQFFMADSRHDPRLFLLDPQKRGILPLDGFHVPRRLAKFIRTDPFDIRVDSAFAEVLAACAAPNSDRSETWINSPIAECYQGLFHAGHAHSVECWQGEQMVGGLYGVAVGAAFFGESMFSRARDASKIALVFLVARLIAGGFQLLDTQFLTQHLIQFGAIEVERALFRQKLAAAIVGSGDFQALPGDLRGAQILQSIAQTS